MGFDAIDIHTALPIKIIGADPTGTEQVPVGSTTINGEGHANSIASLVQSLAVTSKADSDLALIGLDEYGRSQIVDHAAINTQWGQMFHASHPSSALTGTTESPYIYFNNPGGSGKSVKIYNLIFGPTLGNSYCTYRIYFNPTVTVNGTPVVVFGAKQTNQNSTVVSIFFNPTVSSNGVLNRTIVASGLSGQSVTSPSLFTRWIEAGNKVLITRQLSSNATSGAIDLSWTEQ